jgi:hypothetical protein
MGGGKNPQPPEVRRLTLRFVDRSGFWLVTRRWDVSYWAPRAWKPLSVREGWDGSRKGWWGAVRVTRHEAQGGVSG